MRIAHVTATFPPYYGGTGNVCFHNALGRAKAGHEVTVITPAQLGAPYQYPHELNVEPLPTFFRLGNVPIFRCGIKFDKYDIIHLHYPFYAGAEAVLLAARR